MLATVYYIFFITMTNIRLYIIITIASLLNILLFNYFINTHNIVYNHYSELLSYQQLQQLLESQEKWSWLGYAIIPLVILIRTSLVSLCLSIGVFFYYTENQVKFKQLFKITLLGDFIFVLLGYFKFSYFFFVKTNYTLQDIQQFYPLSYINFLTIENIEPWLIYPLQAINLFEIGYFFILVYGLYKLLKNEYLKSFEIVAVSYGTGMVIWVGLIMFLTLNML
jgi:hypothetical protein